MIGNLEDTRYLLQQTEKIINEKLEDICNSYNKAIKKKELSVKEKKALIVKLCQEIEQLHPFSDGNARV